LMAMTVCLGVRCMTAKRRWRSPALPAIAELPAGSGVESLHCRVSTGHNREDGRGHFAGFCPRHQRIGTRRSLT
jgi:hypothetical protein